MKCLKLVIGRDGIRRQCTSDRAAPSDLCPNHLAQAARDYQDILTLHTLGREFSPDRKGSTK